MIEFISTADALLQFALLFLGLWEVIGRTLRQREQRRANARIGPAPGQSVAPVVLVSIQTKTNVTYRA